MRLRNYSIAFVLILSIAIGCSSTSTGPTNEEPQLDLPTASFSVEGDLFTGGEVKLNNTSVDADSYEWQLGDGTTANESNPTKTYSEYGTITITLTAKNSDGEDSISKQVTIKPSKLFIEKMEVVEMPFTNNSGVSWDASSGPDLFVNMANESGETYTVGSPNSDISKSDLPVEWEYDSPGLEIVRSDFSTNFIFILVDEDVSDHDLIQTVPSDYFTIENLWLEDTPATATIENGEGSIKLTLGWE